MTFTIIIVFCSLILLAYLFDFTTSHTKIPSVILLLVLGWIVREVTFFLDIEVPDLSTVLPVLGTIGLILIVLDSSLELEMNKSKLTCVRKSFLGALISMVVLAFFLALLFYILGHYSFKNSLINAIPFCVISSAVAIPSVMNQSKFTKEFIVYESSFSDSLGILFFNFIALNQVINLLTVGSFLLQILLMVIISIVATIGLSLLLSKIEHHIKFVPIIVLIILIYAVSELYHLPSLIFILIFGLALGNHEKIKQKRWAERFHPEELDDEVKRFKELTTEATFLVRSLFFILFGFLIETSELLNAETFYWALGIVASVVLFRVIQIKISGLPLKPLLFVAPRGLITILLFLSIDSSLLLPFVSKSLVIQVIAISAIFMMVGLMFTENKKKNPVEPVSPE
ncbi:MAG: potassium/hydrogen antiporter [Tenuifilum sp.]|jgi:Kef-type K+ transport system membrane component KefB|uniref:hypothetical protein n=1 Tax=Tenuifilum sp. TaxID=2760880 RepID=UPI0024AA9A31|nr:hypothetical protein [Tenuifilum sp.]MDI3526690.1 potassium/hydrogen antiporter [Tenuifilum sp.]